MRTIIGLAALFLVALLVGCATCSLQVETVGTIRNEAILHYAYGETLFNIAASPCDVAIARPISFMSVQIASSKSSIFLSQGKQVDDTSESNLATLSVGTQTWKSDRTTYIGQRSVTARMGQGDAKSSRSLKTTKSMSGSRDQSSSQMQTALAGQEYTTDVQGNTQQQTAQSQVASENTFASLRSSTYSGMDNAEDVAGFNKHSSANTFSRFAIVGADLYWEPMVPAVRKWATRTHIIPGDKFEYVVEIINNSPIDLSIVQIEETLDPRLVADFTEVKTSPKYAIKLEMADKGFRVNILSGLKRGKIVRVQIPVMLRLPN